MSTTTQLNENALQFRITPKTIASQVQKALNLYNNVIASAIQETGSNCDDTTQEYIDKFGLGTRKPYQVSVERKGDFIEIIFVDHGMGMTKKQFLNHYWKIGNSSKEKNNRATGKFGIGAKAILGVSDFYTIATKSVVDGVTHAYTLKTIPTDFDGEILPVFEKEEIQIAPLNIPHGTVTKFQVKAHNLSYVLQGLKQIALTGCEIHLHDNLNLVDFKMPTFKVFKYNGKKYYYSEDNYYQGKVIIGNIPYPTDNLNLPYWVSRCPFMPVFTNQDLQYNETREYIKKDFDGTYGTEEKVKEAYENLDGGLKAEYHNQNKPTNCSELEYFELLGSMNHPSIELDGQKVELNFLNGTSDLKLSHSVYGTELLEVKLNGLHYLFGEVLTNASKFRQIDDYGDSFKKEEVRNVSTPFNQVFHRNVKIIYNGRATQKSMGYYFDFMNDDDNEIVYIHTDNLQAILDVNKTDLALERLVKTWIGNVLSDTVETFFKRVILQAFEKVESSLINCEKIQSEAKENGYNFKKYRNIQIVSGNINVYEGISYGHRRTFDMETLEESENVFVYTVGRSTNFKASIHTYSDLREKYQELFGKRYTKNYRFIRINKSDMNKKALRDFVENADNFISEDNFLPELIAMKDLWKPVIRYYCKLNLYKKLEEFKLEHFQYNETLSILFNPEIKWIENTLKTINLKYRKTRYYGGKELIRDWYEGVLTQLLELDDSFKRIYNIVETLKEDKYSKLSTIADRVEQVESISEWLKFTHNEEAFNYALPILKEKGIELSEDQIARIKKQF